MIQENIEHVHEVKEPHYRDGKLILDAGPPKKDGSHRCGVGRSARWAWGAKEDCKTCTAYEASVARQRALYTCNCGELLKRGQERCDACAKVFSPQIEDAYAIPSLAAKLAVNLLVVAVVFFAFGFYVASAIAAGK